VPKRSEFYPYVRDLGEDRGLFLATGGIDIRKAANNPLATRLDIKDEQARAERFVELVRGIIDTWPVGEDQRGRRVLEVALNFPSADVPGDTLTHRLESLSNEPGSRGVSTLQKAWYDGADWLAKRLVEEIDGEPGDRSQQPPAAADDDAAQVRIQQDERPLTTDAPHPEEQREAPADMAPDTATPSRAGQRLTRRAAIYVALAVGIGVVGVMAFIALQSSDNSGGLLKNGWRRAQCADVGNNQPGNLDPLWGNLFREAYQRAGGEAELGCPRTDDPSGYLHPWANGLSQDLQGGKAGKARIMTLRDPRRVLVVAGTYYEDYTTPYGDNAAQTMGYPVSDSIPCGPTMKVVLLNGAEKTKYFAREQTPSAMVTNPRTSRLIWIPRDIWERYVPLGGPLGRLGGPLSNLEQAPTGGAVQYFEHGYIKVVDGMAKTDLEDRGLQEPSSTNNIPSCLPG
jgi:hypothetical protein